MRMTHNFIKYSKLYHYIFVSLTKLGFIECKKMCKSCAKMNDFIFSLQNINIKVVNWKIIDINLTKADFGDFLSKKYFRQIPIFGTNK